MAYKELDVRNILWSLSMGAVAAGCMGQLDEAPLFIHAGATKGDASSVGVVRAREVHIPSAALNRLRRWTDGDETREELATVTANLFPDASFSFAPSRVERTPQGALVVSGQLDHDALTSGTLRIEGSQVRGHFNFRGRTFELSPNQTRGHTLEELAPAETPGCGVTTPQTQEDSYDTSALMSAALSREPDEHGEGATIDLMIVYTPAAEEASDDIEAELELAVADVNQALINSEVRHRVRLVGARRAEYEEGDASLSDHYSAFNKRDDGVIDEVHAWRQELDADVAVFWVKGKAGDYCGWTWPALGLHAFFGASRKGLGKAIVRGSCSDASLILAHELGHVLGGEHETSSSPGLFPFGFGYVSKEQRFRTIMGVTRHTTRLPLFSNPRLSHLGHALGVAGMGADASDMHRLINITGAWVADFFGPERSKYYCPSQPVTRAQMATFLMRLKYGAGFEPVSATGMFKDVDPNSVHAPFIEQLAIDGITKGCRKGHFCPGDPVTRAQMASFLVRYDYGSDYEAPDATGIFEDVPVTATHAANIEQLARGGVTKGCKEDYFCPQDFVTRAQMASFLYRISHEPWDHPRAGGTLFADLSSKSAHVSEVEYLYKHGITTGCTAPIEATPAAQE